MTAQVFRPVRDLKKPITRKRKPGVAIQLRLTMGVPLQAKGTCVVLALDETRDAIDDWVSRATTRARQMICPLLDAQCPLSAAETSEEPDLLLVHHWRVGFNRNQPLGTPPAG